MTVASVSKTPKKSPGRDWQSPKIEKAWGSLPNVSPRSYTLCKLASIVSGMTGKAFHTFASASVVGGTGLPVGVRVGCGVMGENCFGFLVAVGCKTGAAAGAGSVCVERITGAFSGSLRRAGREVAASVQEARSMHINRDTKRHCFIQAKYIW